MHRRSATRCAMTASVKPPLAAAAASAVVEAATWSGTETLRASGVSTQKRADLRCRDPSAGPAAA